MPWAHRLDRWVSSASRSPEASCLHCRGVKLLCGRPACPVLFKIRAYAPLAPSLQSTQVDGSSPPDIFIGRARYPRVTVGPLVPPYRGDTSILAEPERWLQLSREQIVKGRLSLVRGVAEVDARRPLGRMLEELVELGISARPAEVEMELKSKPVLKTQLDPDSQPFGPSAPLRDLKAGGVKADRRIEKAYEDTDLKASEAVLQLYRGGVPVSAIIRALSLGALGLKSQRRLVPTRWSITAVDSMIGLKLISELRSFEELGEYEVYEAEKLDNKFVVVLTPRPWSYELIEAWYPSTAWNLSSESIAVGSDWEGYYGRSSYASIGGCYYAARLAVAEHLYGRRRQAAAVVLREAYPGHIMPLGVWQVRESVRLALRQKPARYSSLQEILEHISERMLMPLEAWLQVSRLLKPGRQAKLVEKGMLRGRNI